MTNKVYLDVLSFIVPDFNERTATGIRRMFPNLDITDGNIYDVIAKAEKSPLYLPTIMEGVARSRYPLPVIKAGISEAIEELLTWDKEIILVIPTFLLTFDELVTIAAALKERSWKYLSFKSATDIINTDGLLVVNSGCMATLCSMRSDKVKVMVLKEYTAKYKPVDLRKVLASILSHTLASLEGDTPVEIVISEVVRKCSALIPTRTVDYIPEQTNNTADRLSTDIFETLMHPDRRLGDGNFIPTINLK